MKVKLQRVLEDCLERGITYGYNRAFKHTDTPSEEVVKDQIMQAILNELYEYFDMTGDGNDE